jgi:hypothetical protein
MAEVTDIESVTDDFETVSDVVQEQGAASSEPVQETSEQEVIPEKYRGKTTKQLIDELEHANKYMGKYSNELGEVRRLADELIKSQLQPAKKEEPAREVDFFENPQEAIRKAVETNPEVQMAKQYAIQAQRAQAQAAFNQKHPDSGQILQDAQFGEWIQSSKIRTELFQKANAFDVDAADELFSTYKQLKAVKAAQTQSKVDSVEKAARDTALKAASVDTGGTGESSQKIWSRAKIMHMRLYEKAKFEAAREEIERAYQEGRVK